MDDTLDDFIAKYKNTYVHLKLNQGEFLTQFVDTVPDTLIFNSPVIGDIRVTFDKAKKVIKTRFPVTGLYNIDQFGFCLFYRIPERQFKRCPCNSNSVIRLVGTNKKLKINFDTINACFYPSYPQNKREVLLELKTRKGVALNRKFALSLTSTNNLDLWYYNNIIGYIEDASRIVVLNQSLLQETKDFFGEELTWI